MKQPKKETDIKKSEVKKEEGLFSLKRKPILSSYNGVESARTYLSGRRLFNRRGSNVKDLSTFYNSSDLDPYFRNPGTRLTDCVTLSSTLYATNRIYQQIIKYLVDMFYWRTVVVPRKIKRSKNTTNKEDYLKTYHNMLEIVDGFNTSVTFPKILLSIFKNGQVFLYATADKKSKTVSTVILPAEYCYSSVETQYGTTQVMFDFSFFETLISTKEERDQIFSLFPPEFEELYNAYKETSQKLLPLNPKLSTSISMNSVGFPTFLSVFYDLIDYKTYKLNELDRSTNALERIVAQEIDMEKTGMEMPEIEALQESLASTIDGNGTTTITTPGKIGVHQIQEEISQENKALSNAYKSIYDNAGFNDEMFSGDSEESLFMSLKRDKNFVWGFIEQIVNFYNLAANNLYSFGDYQLSFRVLPISPYDEKEKLEQYRANATLGVNIVDLIVASGVDQIDIESTLELEENLNLVSRLMPLQSSHTQSLGPDSSSTIRKEEDEDVKDEDEQDSDKKEEVQKDKNNPGVKSSNDVEASNKE